MKASRSINPINPLKPLKPGNDFSHYSINTISDGSNEFVWNEGFTFANGESINPLVLVYETFGQLNSEKDNAIIVHHALSTDSHLTATAANPQKGWWQDMVGPGKALDTDKYCIICVNNLGSCFGSSGPASIDPRSNEPYAMDFPNVTIEDMVRSQKLLLDNLGIEKLHAIVGSSMGAMLSIAWIALYPDHARHFVSISSCVRSYPANRANRTVQKEMITIDPRWNRGRYVNSHSLAGFQTARKHGLLTYRNWTEVNDRFLGKEGKDSIEHYLNYNSQKFTRRFDCNSYLYLLDAMDNFDLSLTGVSLAELFQGIQAKSLVVCVDSDILFSPSQQLELHESLLLADVDTQLIEHHSSFGHDAFLIETEAFGEYIRSFIY